MRYATVLVAVVLVVGTLGAYATTVEYTDRTTFLNDVTSGGATVNTINFDEVPVSTVLASQYSGLTFVDGNDTTLLDSAFVVDGVGARGNGRLDIQLASGIHSLGIDYPGAAVFDFYSGSSLIETSSNFGSSGTGFFAGAIWDPGDFDRVVIRDWVDDEVFVDTLYFGTDSPPIPEPATLSLLSLGLTGLAIRRYRKQ